MHFKLYCLLIIFLINLLPQAALASNTLLPVREGIEEVSGAECLLEVSKWMNEPTNNPHSEKLAQKTEKERDDFLACAVKSGKIKFWMLPFFIRNILQFLINISGLLAVLMILIGAYYYVAGGLSDDKEKGKKTITYALGGLVLVILSWFIVNIVLLALTG